MKTTIGRFDPDTGTVPVTFKLDDKKHSRRVNAVIADDGTYDRAATAARVAEVAAGVAQKFALGVIGSNISPILPSEPAAQ